MDDLMQVIFIKIHSHVGHLRESGKLSSLIYRIAENTLNDYYRNGRSGDVTYEEDEPARGGPNEENPLKGIEGCIEAFIERLPEKYRDPLVMSDLEGMKQKEIAENMNISYSGLMSRAQRGREMTKDMFVECCKLSVGIDGRLMGEVGEMDDCTLCGRNWPDEKLALIDAPAID